MKQQDLEKAKEYKYGFVTDIESIKAPKGLNEDVIKFISKIKKEPKWMLEWRLKAFKRLKNIKEMAGLLISHHKIIIPIGKIIISNGDVLIPIRKNNI